MPCLECHAMSCHVAAALPCLAPREKLEYGKVRRVVVSAVQRGMGWDGVYDLLESW